MSVAVTDIGFAPQKGPQTWYVQCPCDIIIFGGARGGGKTIGSLGEFWIHSERYGIHARGLMLRRNYTDLKDTVAVAMAMYGADAKWSEQKACFVFRTGAILYMAYLENDTDAENYQGWSLTRVYAEEMTQFPTPAPLFKLFATLRSATGVPCQFRGTCNPGGAGHLWVKQWVIDNGPYNVVTDPDSGLTRVYIPSRLVDNPALLAHDPRYVERLKSSGSPELVRAWLEGDWNVIEGAFFSEFSVSRHVLQPFHIPTHWTRFRSMDWGSAKPFSIGWWAVVQDDYVVAPGRSIPRGAIVRYREWYGWNGIANEGCRLTATQVAHGIVERETLSDYREEIAYGVLDPSAWNVVSGPSIAEELLRAGAIFRRADNRRVAGQSPTTKMSGWDQLRNRLIGDDGRPMLYMFSTCTHLIRTLPIMQHDPKNAEDIDTDLEDHAVDECRYACMSRPYLATTRTMESRDPFLVANAFGLTKLH